MAKRSTLSLGDVETENTDASPGNEPETDSGEIIETGPGEITVIVKQSERRNSE